MTSDTRPLNDRDLLHAAQQVETPFYVYDLGCLTQQYKRLSGALEGAMGLRYAVKANPHPLVLEKLIALGLAMDASSIGEVHRALAAGAVPSAISFSGPGKRRAEIEEAVQIGIGSLVLESLTQARMASEAACRLGVEQRVMVRISPAKSPRGFGARMTGRVTQFGIEETQAEDAILTIRDLPGLRLDGFHFYTGSNSLDPHAIAENIAIFCALSRRLGALPGCAPTRLIFGAGFGLNYHDGEVPLDLEACVADIQIALAALMNDPVTAGAAVELELGRWLVGPAGVMVTSVLDRKQSQDQAVCICDAGFHTHMAACGMMGSVLRRNWPIRNLTTPDAPPETVMLAGPLCTSIDLLAREIEIARLDIGAFLAVGLSGAYGPTASPSDFISHPEATELIWTGEGFGNDLEANMLVEGQLA